MYSHRIDLQLSEIKFSENQRASRPAPYRKKDSNKKISEKLQEKSLDALKQLLAKQKKIIDSQHAMSAMRPFSEIQLQKALAEENTARIEKIAPSAQVMQLYNKLVDKLFFIHQNGIQETTLLLEGEGLSSSVFQGTKITITEYSTAPKVFNIKIATTAEALSYFEGHASSLLNALQKGKFGFSVYQLDTELLTEKEKPSIPPVERDLEKEEDPQ